MAQETILNKMYDLILYMIPQLEKYPRSQKFLLADRMETGLLDILDHLLRAYYGEKSVKKDQLIETNLCLEQLRFLIRLSHDLKFLSHKKYGIMSEKVNEIGKMTGGWLKKILNSTLKCNSKTGCEKSGTAVGFALFPPSKMRSTNETLQPAHAGTKI
ncbi:MAG: diversity-generating retroelement protein Avd, partial [Candidatus Jacksonbacteria bacterium]|nr:diversity-generating retroelement protein Avd [Candidatus Jacksonbacteria bacterium]